MITAKEAREIKGTDDIKLELTIKSSSANGHSACKYSFSDPELEKILIPQLLVNGYAIYGESPDYLIVWMQ